MNELVTLQIKLWHINPNCIHTFERVFFFFDRLLQPVPTLVHQYWFYSKSSLLCHSGVERVGMMKLIIQDLIPLGLGFFPLVLDCSPPTCLFARV